jgi:selenocysteine lyase/cysteine desulfurase
MKILLDGISGRKKIRLQGAGDPERQIAVVSITMDGMDSADVAGRLDRQFGVACRAGLHCAPEAHRTLGTFPQGTIRLSPSRFTTEDDMRKTVRALHILESG